MEIREIELCQLDLLTDCFNYFEDYYAALGEHRLSRSPQFGHDFAKALVQRLGQQKGKIYAVFQQEKIVGFIVGIIQNQTADEEVAEGPVKYGKILELFVEPNFRRRQLGLKLFRALEEFFAVQNCTELILEMHPDNMEAEKFYTALGFGTKNIIFYKKAV